MDSYLIVFNAQPTGTVISRRFMDKNILEIIVPGAGSNSFLK